MNCGIVEILKYFPSRVRNVFLNTDINIIERISEVRLKAFCPLLVCVDGVMKSLSPKSTLIDPSNGIMLYGEDIEYTYGMLIKESVYAYSEDISNCFVTADGGHRAGISGSAIIKNGEIIGMKDISGIYFRVARECFGCADKILDIVNHDGRILNTVIAAPPGRGKTTLLRELSRVFSLSGSKVTIIDERYEIASMNGNMSSFDIAYADVLNGYPKALGIERAIRTHSPDILIFDELGSYGEAEAVSYALNCGVSFVTSAHASSLNELLAKPSIKLLTDIKAIDVLVLYDLGSIKDVRFLKGERNDKNCSFELDLRDLHPHGFNEEA